jgi:hypothetical protein
MSAGLKVGAKFTAKLPLIGEAETSVELSVSYTHTWGTSTAKTKSKQIVANCVVPAGQKYRCKMIG